LQQVAWNLLSNAVKFTPAGGRVEVRLEPVNGHLRLQVMDTGKGINPAFLPYVFDRFRQADQSSTRSHGGLGIGLTIVRHIIELHGGEVHAESAGEGRGATFTVMLPPPVDGLDDSTGDALERPSTGVDSPQRSTGAASVAGAPAAAAAARGCGELPSLANVRVLVVDDERDARDVLAHTLGRAGAKVTTCPSVREAIDAIAMELPDVIVSDIAMPGEDGYDLVRRLRRTVHASRVPAIAITAYAREEDRAKALLAGFERHVAKPIDPAEVVCAVAELLPQSHNGNGKHSPNPSPTVSA
jgi:CheY-like chemotaxis protein